MQALCQYSAESSSPPACQDWLTEITNPFTGPLNPQVAGSMLPTEIFEIRKSFNPHIGKAKTEH